MDPEPDTKDWTWVLDRPCPECGFDASAVLRDDLGSLTRETVARWEAVVRRPDVGIRPAQATWSSLEYACHVRDVYRVFDGRLRLMLTEHDPLFPNWDQDATAVESRYGEQDPASVRVELADAGEVIAGVFASVVGDAWARGGRRSNGSAFTVESLGRYFLHDVLHHLHDVRG